MAQTPLGFQIIARSARCAARVGRITTPHGVFDTPAFMPVGTRATVRGLLPGLVAGTGAQVVLANTYHLLLRPGPEIVRSQGGLHRFMGWPGPILTDSGGYQAFSMADTNSVDDDGVTFKSIVDGSAVRLTPEIAVHTQNALGADIIMPLDDCPPTIGQSPADAGPERVRAANDRTIRWLARCVAAHQRPDDQALFGIVQGGTDPEERARSARGVTGLDLPGYAIGGVAVGEPSDQIAAVVAHTAPLLPTDKPRYLMGVGYERDLVAAVIAGVDMFDCVLPTRNGRNATAFTPGGPLKLRNARHASDPSPIDAGCDCVACRGAEGGTGPFSRAYLRHLFMAEEMLGPILVSLHNLRHFQRFMADLRSTIASDGWAGLVSRWPASAAGVPEGLLSAAAAGGG